MHSVGGLFNYGVYLLVLVIGQRMGGDGPLRDALQQSAQGLDNVRFAGWLTREQLIELIELIDSSRPLADALGEILTQAPDELRQKAIDARAAAESFNRETIGQWLDVIRKYAQPEAKE